MGSASRRSRRPPDSNVTVLEVEQKFLDKGFAGIEKSLAKFVERPVEKGGITVQQKDAIQARLKGTTNRQNLSGLRHRDRGDHRERPAEKKTCTTRSMGS